MFKIEDTLQRKDTSLKTLLDYYFSLPGFVGEKQTH